MAINFRNKTQPPLRKRIIYWSITLLFMVVVPLAIITLQLLYDQLLRQIDSRLEREAVDVRRSISFSDDGEYIINDIIEWEEDHHQFNTTIPFYLMILDQHKNAVKLSANLTRNVIPLNSLQYNDELSMFNTIEWSGLPYRFMTYPIYEVNRFSGWLVVGMPLERVNSLLVVLVKYYFALLPILLLVGIIGSIFIARKITKPITAISTQTQVLNISDFSQLLPVPDSRDEIASMVVVINNLLTKLRNSLQSIRQFTANASHELKTPVSVIQLELDELQETRRADDRDAIVTKISSELYRMGRIIDHLSILTKVDSGGVTLETGRVWLNDIIFNEVERIRSLAHRSGINIMADDIISATVQGDTYWLRCMVANILDNAVKYSPDHSTIRCTLRRHDHQLKFSVLDEGPGAPESALPNLTQRFFRGANVSHIPGSGLGLSIVEWIATRHNGHMEIENRSTGGLKVSVVLLPV